MLNELRMHPCSNCPLYLFPASHYHMSASCLYLPVSRVSTLLCPRSLPAPYKHLHSLGRPHSSTASYNGYQQILSSKTFYSSFKRHFQSIETGNQLKKEDRNIAGILESAPLFSRNGLNILTSLTIP